MTILAWMALLSFTQVILRWVSGDNILWADEQLRMMVLAIGMSGGVLAAAESKHIKLDVISHLLARKTRRIIGRLAAGASGIGCFLLGLESLRFVQFERRTAADFRGLLFGMDLAGWVPMLILPAGFFLMSFFFISAALGWTPTDQEVS